MYLAEGDLVIRNARPADAETLCRWWNDGKVMEHAGFPLGLATDAASIRSELAADSDEGQRRLMIEIDSVPVGEMSYHRKDGNVAEIGIKICDSNKHDKGYGSRFLSMLIESLFNDLGFTKIILDTNLKNTRAHHVYEKLGFKKVATRLDAWKNQVGELMSFVDYELSKADYMNRPGKETRRENIAER